MLKKVLAVAFVSLCCISSAYAQKRGPSTPEERQKVRAMVNFLETNPLAKEAKDIRAGLLFYLTEVPDITVTLCSNILGESKQIKGDYETEIFGQLAFSQAKFIIENPDKAQDQAAVYVATVEGVLRTWQSIKTAKPKAKFPLLDELVARQQAGTLPEYVQNGMKKCTK